MLGSAILEVAIGLIFVYLLLSLVCSSCAEGIESFFKQRARFLEAGIRRMLGDSAEAFYAHALIKPLFSEEANGDKPAYISAADFTAALSSLCKLDFADAGKLKDSIEKIQNAQVKDALNALHVAAANDIARFRQGMTTWFNNAMSGVGSWYKRRAQAIIFVIGLSIAILANADTINMARSFSRDKALREVVVQAAAEYAKSPPKAKEEKGGSAGDPFAQVEANFAKLDKLGLPLGWHLQATKDDALAIPGEIGPIFLKLGGLLLTALAISLGAPFWFDILNKFIVVRSTIKPDEKARKERSTTS